MNIKGYIQCGGEWCLFCGGDDIEGGSFTVEAGVAWQGMSCNGCDATWLNYYTLDRVGLVDEAGDIQVFGEEGPE